MGDPRKALSTEGPTLVEGARHAGRAPELSLHGPASRPGDRAEWRTRRRADRRVLSRSTREHRSVDLPITQLGPRGLPGFDPVLGDDGGGDRHRRQAATRPFAMLPSAGTTWPTTSRMVDVLRALRRGQVAEDLLRQLFRKGADGRWLWPGYGENSACSSGSSSGAPAEATPSRRRSVSYRRTRRSTSRDSTSRWRTDRTVDGHHDEWRHEVPRIREHFASSVTICPETPRRSQSPRSQAGVVRPDRGDARARQFERSRARRLRRPR